MSTTTKVREKPILFSGPMVRAIAEGRKTQTRRICNRDPGAATYPDNRLRGPVGSSAFNFHGLWTDDERDYWVSTFCPYGEVGDRLWVREAWAPSPGGAHGPGNPILYRADDGPYYDKWSWKPSIHMPRWASRYTLEITGVRVERVQEISEEDAIAEGSAESWTETWWQGYRETDLGLLHQQATGDEPPEWMIDPKRMNTDYLRRTAAQNFGVIWDQINFKRAPWSRNPWVWAISFKVLA